jgi:hypothetical protein
MWCECTPVFLLELIDGASVLGRLLYDTSAMLLVIRWVQKEL